MSFSSNRRDALDATLLLSHRVSHARSCAMLVGQKWRVKRDAVIEAVLKRTGVDLNEVTDEQQLVVAIQVLEALRTRGLADDQIDA